MNKKKAGFIVLGLSALTGLGWWASKQAKKLADGLTYKINGIGVPSIAGSTVTVPVMIQFHNASDLSVTIDDLTIYLSYLQNGKYVQAGFLQQKNFTVQSGTQNITVSPQLDIRALFSNLLNTITSVLSSKQITVKANVNLTVKGVTVSHDITKDISIKI